MNNEFLNLVNSPEDLKAIPEKDIPALCSELREFLVENIEQTGGHLASNLGVAEITVAIHRVFDSPRDHIIFDVGHQSYVHKIITGRKDDFKNLRKTGGLSGFTSRKESEHDPFGAGHSSTSVSAALGYAEADRLMGNDSYTVAVLGDGAFTGGMAHEALNNCNPDSRLIIILNENGMSISVNKGRFASYLSRVRISKGYRKWKKGTTSLVSAIPLIGKPIKRFLTYIKTKVKNLFWSPNYFEDLGLYYIGAIDGNDYKKVERALVEAKSLSKCTIIHVKTKKGKGYLPAEENPDSFHSVATSSATKKLSYHDVFARKLTELAKRDEKIVAVTAAMGIGTGLEAFGKEFPKRYFDVGIAEEHAMTFSAGLAANGMKPFVAIYSTFLQRAYDNIIHDVALQALPVKMIIDRASLSVSDGATHHGIFDVAFLSHIPNVEIFAPATDSSLEEMLVLAKDSDKPCAIRYANACESETVKKAFFDEPSYVSPYVRANFKKGECKYAFITYGNVSERVLAAADILNSRGVKTGVVLLEKLKPYKSFISDVIEIISGVDKLVFVEEGIKNGGAAMNLREELLTAGFDLSKTDYEIIAVDDNFASPNELCELYDYLGMSPDKLSKSFLD